MSLMKVWDCLRTPKNSKQCLARAQSADRTQGDKAGRRKTPLDVRRGAREIHTRNADSKLLVEPKGEIQPLNFLATDVGEESF